MSDYEALVEIGTVQLTALCANCGEQLLQIAGRTGRWIHSYTSLTVCQPGTCGECGAPVERKPGEQFEYCTADREHAK